MKENSIPAKDVVRRFHIPYHTLNYYTTMGLLPIEGKDGHRRLYNEKETKRRLEVIARLTNEGYPLHLIRKKLA